MKIPKPRFDDYGNLVCYVCGCDVEEYDSYCSQCGERIEDYTSQKIKYPKEKQENEKSK